MAGYFTLNSKGFQGPFRWIARQDHSLTDTPNIFFCFETIWLFWDYELVSWKVFFAFGFLWILRGIQKPSERMHPWHLEKIVCCFWLRLDDPTWAFGFWVLRTIFILVESQFCSIIATWFLWPIYLKQWLLTIAARSRFF